GALRGIQDYAWSPDGRQLAAAAGTWDKLSIKIWDTATWQEKRTIALGSPPVGIHSWYVGQLSWSPDGGRLTAVAVWPRTWDVTTGKEVPHPRAPRRPGAVSLGWGREGHWLVYFFETHTLWDVTAGKEIASLPKDTHIAGAFAGRHLSPDGRRLAIAE